MHCLLFRVMSNGLRTILVSFYRIPIVCPELENQMPFGTCSPTL
jgi:hypothetical protein